MKEYNPCSVTRGHAHTITTSVCKCLSVKLWISNHVLRCIPSNHSILSHRDVTVFIFYFHKNCSFYLKPKQAKMFYFKKLEVRDRKTCVCLCLCASNCICSMDRAPNTSVLPFQLHLLSYLL